MAVKLNDYRLLGRSGLRVSPLSLGTMTFGVKGGWGSSDEEARAIVDRYMEEGGNFIDTANFYGHESGSEKVLGDLLQGRRERVVLSTKYTLTTSPGDPNASGNHRKNMIRSVEDSLRRLKTDYIDLFYLHMWDYRTPVEEILRAFDDLVTAGKIQYVGISDTPAWQISRMQAIADLRGWAPLVALQVVYNLTERDAEREMLPMAKEMGLGVMPWSPLAGGILSGKYSQGDVAQAAGQITSAPDTRKDINQLTGKLSARNLQIAAVAGEVARELGVTPAQVALAWTMRDKVVTSPLLGVRTLAQLEDNLGALNVEFTDDQIERMNAVGKIELGFPHDMLNGNAIGMMFGHVNVERRG